MPIEKTVIGSFPRSNKPLYEAIKEVIELQLRNDIDLVVDGEQRCDMIRYFDQIPGLEKTDCGLKITGKIAPIPRKTLDDFYKFEDYATLRSILKSLGKEATKAKITITGPMTLGTICASADINSAAEHYDLENEETMFQDFSNALLPIIERALAMGAYVQIDEPQLSTGQIQLKTAKKILKDFTSKLPSKSINEEKISLHACGSIKSVLGMYDALLNLDVPVLSLGFSGDLERENLDIISRETLKGHGKKLGAGFISNVNVEDDAVVLGRYRKIEGIVGRENIKYVHPDCGFGLTRPEKVRLILEKMKKTADQIN